MYGLPQSGRIEHDALGKHLDPYVYHFSRKPYRLWKHNSGTINFTLVVDDFGVKYSGKEYALHLKAALKIYKVTTDWEGKLYVGIALKWDYEKVTVQFSMPRYVRAALHYFQYKKPKRPQDSPQPWTQPVYGKNNQMLSETAPDEE